MERGTCGMQWYVPSCLVLTLQLSLPQVSLQRTLAVLSLLLASDDFAGLPYVYHILLYIHLYTLHTAVYLPGRFGATLFCLICNSWTLIVLTVMLRTSQPGKIGLGPHIPNTCAAKCDQSSQSLLFSSVCVHTGQILDMQTSLLLCSEQAGMPDRTWAIYT